MISSGLQLGGLPWSENKVGQMGKVKTENWKHWKCVCVHCETCHVTYKWTYLAGKLLGHTRNEYQLRYTCGGLHKAPKTTLWVVAYSPPLPHYPKINQVKFGTLGTYVRTDNNSWSSKDKSAEWNKCISWKVTIDRLSIKSWLLPLHKGQKGSLSLSVSPSQAAVYRTKISYPLQSVMAKQRCYYDANPAIMAV